MEFLLYISCPTYPYRAVVNYYCHINLVKLLPCIKCLTSYGIFCHISIVQHILTEQLPTINTTYIFYNYCHVLNVTYLMEMIIYINSLTFSNREVVNYYCHIILVKLLPCIYCHNLLELLSYINCPTYPYRVTYYCHTNLKKLLLCIKWHIHY